MKCFKCGKGLQDGVVLLRQNEEGEAGSGACEADSRKEPDPEVRKLTAIIQKNNNKSTLH